MKKFLYKVSFFLVLIFTILGLGELGICLLKTKLFNETNLGINIVGAAKEYNWVNNIKGKDKVLLMGSSCVRYGLSCTKLNELSKHNTSFINLAMDARGPIHSYFILKQLDLSEVKSIYFGIDPWIYAKAYYKTQNDYMYLDMNFRESCFFGKEHDSNIFLKRHKNFVKSFFVSEPSQYKYNDVILPDYGSVKLKGKPVNFNNSVNEWFQIEKYGWSQLQLEYLVKIANTCKKHHIAFYTFIPPKRSDFSQIYKSKCAEVHQEFISNLKSAGFDAPILGTFDQLDKEGDYDLFVEAYHLNSKGQDVYSKIFYDMIKNHKQNFSPPYSWFKDK